MVENKMARKMYGDKVTTEFSLHSGEPVIYTVHLALSKSLSLLQAKNRSRGLLYFTNST